MLRLTGHPRPQPEQHTFHLVPIWPLKCRKSPFLGARFTKTALMYVYMYVFNEQKFSIELA